MLSLPSIDAWFASTITLVEGRAQMSPVNRQRPSEHNWQHDQRLRRLCGCFQLGAVLRLVGWFGQPGCLESRICLCSEREQVPALVLGAGCLQLLDAHAAALWQ